MEKKEFSEFKNCKLSTDEIINKTESFVKSFGENAQNDLLKFLYSLLHSTDIKVENEADLQKIINGYLGYKQGNLVTINTHL